MVKLLRVNLTDGTSREESVPDEIVRRYVGSKGIGTHYLLEEVPADADPLGPQNKLILSCGPLSGSAMPGSNRYAAYFISPLTGGYGEAYSGGNVATQFARTGYRMVIIEGRAPTPVFLEVSEEGASIHPADDVWGLGIYDAEPALLEKVGVKGARAAVIGPAGERLVRFACVINDHTHVLGRGGPGAVAGSKNLKGVVWHGSRTPKVARPVELKALVKEMAGICKDHPSVLAYGRMGTVQMVRVTNELDMFPTRYWQKGRLEGWEDALHPDVMVERYKVKNTTCPPCLIQCGNLCRVPSGPLEGLEIEPEFETIYAFGGLCEIPDLAQVMRMNEICDRLGVDTMTAGNLCALAIEATRQGKLDAGVDYGDADGVAAFLEGMCLRSTKLGDVFAEGVLEVERRFGLKGLAVHVKGMEPAGYDPRRSKGMGLGYAMTERGACHMRATFMKAELSGLIDIDQIEGKGTLYVDWENRFVLMDCMIFCRFYRDMLDREFLTRIVNAAVGLDDDPDELWAKANAIVTETHEVNRRRGFGPEQESLPSWITEHAIIAKDGSELRFTREMQEAMRREYYAARGWGEPPS